MKPKYIGFTEKHPARKKEDRMYLDKPPLKGDYGASYSTDFLKVDIDDFNHKTGKLVEPLYGEPRSQTVVWILDELDIKYNGIITEHGKHLFFKKPESMEEKNKQNWLCPLGICMEWKFPKSDDHIPLKINGAERKFFKGSIENEDIDELPFFLYPLQKGQKPFEIDFPEGDRTQKLCAYLFYLVNKGYSAEQAFEIIRLINDYIFETPIPDDLLESQILNDKTMDKLLVSEQTSQKKDVSHSDLAKEIINQFNLITVNGDFYTYENGVYRPFSDGKITNYLTGCYPKLNINFEREVTRHIKGLTYTEYPEDDGKVNVKNGILKFDGSGGVGFLPHSEEHISFKQFNVIYAPDAKSKLLDDTLLKWFNGSLEQVELFNQVLGYLLMNHVNYQKIFFFIGAPSTGKSTLLKLIQIFCGKENVSAIQLDDMNKPFGLASIVNKTANIFSDIRKTKVMASDIFKMLADGSPLKINQKYKQEFTYSFTGKLLFGMNNYPDFSNDFEGVERRLVIFTFNHIFSKSDAGYDPAILEKLTTDECMSALLNRAIDGYKQLINNNGFTDTKESKKALDEFVSDNDTVIRWLYESEIDEDYLLREPIKIDGYKGLYPDYCSYCLNIGETAKAQKDFSRTICNKYNFNTYTKRIGKERPQMFRKK